MDTIRFELLGPPNLLVGGRSVGVETRKALAVLARVVVEGPQRRDTLDALLWPGSDARRARQALRRTLSALRKALPDGSLAEGDVVALAAPVRTDIDDVEHLAGPGVTTDDTTALAAAADLHRGEFLEGLHFRDAEDFEHWRRDTGQHLDRRRVQVLERWCRALVSAHDFDAAIDVATDRLALDPLHEPSHQQLMLLYAWQGDRTAAARQYAACARVLDEQLGVAPLPKTAALDRAVRAGTLEPPPKSSPSLDGGEGGGTTTERTTPQPPPSTPLVGRGEQLAGLVDRWGDCGDGGEVAVIAGEAGIGKTRLTEELVAATTGPVLRVTGRHEDASLAYAPVMATLRGSAATLQQLDDATRSQVARLVPDAAGVPAPDAPLASAADRARFVDACATALLAPLSDDEDPGVLVIEDLDRADDETRELVVHLVARLTDHPVFVVITCREVPQGLDTGLRLDLVRLSRPEVEELAAARDAETVADRLYDESEGVPFLVVSYLDARVDGDGDWALPAAGRDLVRQRLDRLDEVPRQVLAAAALLGGRQSTDTLERVSGRSPDEVVDAVETLTAAGITIVDEDGRCELTHDKLRTVVLDDTSPVRRRLLHRRAADALLAMPQTVAAATLAHHLAEAGREREAASAHAAAGRHAADLYANTEAIAHCERALAMGHSDPAGLLLLLGDLRVRTGDYTGAEQRYVRASAHAADMAVVEQRLGSLALRRGDDDAAEARLGLALEAGPTGDLLVRTLAPLAQVLARRGDLATAAELAARAVDEAEVLRPTTPAAVAHNVAGLVARRQGDLQAARRHLRSSLAAAEQPEHRAAALNNLAQVMGEDGATEEAIVVAREALEAGRATGDRHREAALLSNLADLLHAAGRTTEAIALQAEAAERFAGVGESATTSPEIWRLVDW